MEGDHSAASSGGILQSVILRGQTFQLLVIAVLSGLLVRPGLCILANVYLHDEDYSFGFVIPLIAAYAAWEQWGKRPVCTSSWFGVPFLILGTGIMLLGYWYDAALFSLGSLGAAILSAAGMLLCLTGLCLALGGFRLTQTLAFPLGYLVFAIPLPPSLTKQITVTLQATNSALAETVLRLVDIPIFREGNLLHLANTTLGVADACSGIRSLHVMTATAIGFAYLLKCDFLKSLALCAAAVPIAMGVNLFRIVLTAVLVIGLGVEYAAGTRHEMIGLVVFVLGLLMLMGFGLFLSRLHKPPAGATLRKQAPKAVSDLRLVVSPGTGICLIVILLCGLAASHVIIRHYDHQLFPINDRKTFEQFPGTFGDFTEIGRKELPDAQMEKLLPSDELYRSYERANGQQVDLRVLYWDPSEGRSAAVNVFGPHLPDGCYPATGWFRERSFDLNGEIPGIPEKEVNVRLFSKSGLRRVVLFRHCGNYSKTKGWSKDIGHRFRGLLNSWHAPVVKQGYQYIVTIEADVTSSVDSARETAIDLAKTVSPLLAQYGIIPPSSGE